MISTNQSTVSRWSSTNKSAGLCLTWVGLLILNVPVSEGCRTTDWPDKLALLLDIIQPQPPPPSPQSVRQYHWSKSIQKLCYDWLRSSCFYASLCKIMIPTNQSTVSPGTRPMRVLDCAWSPARPPALPTQPPPSPGRSGGIPSGPGWWPPPASHPRPAGDMSRLSGVESFLVTKYFQSDDTSDLLCHKEPAKGTQAHK